MNICQGTPSELLGNAECLQSFLDWLYNGFINLNDGDLKESMDIDARLKHYLELIRLAARWDIPLFKTHVEGRILVRRSQYIRIENVGNVYQLARTYRSERLEKFCKEVCEGNPDIMLE